MEEETDKLWRQPQNGSAGTPKTTTVASSFVRTFSFGRSNNSNPYNSYARSSQSRLKLPSARGSQNIEDLSEKRSPTVTTPRRSNTQTYNEFGFDIPNTIEVDKYPHAPVASKSEWTQETAWKDMIKEELFSCIKCNGNLSEIETLAELDQIMEGEKKIGLYEMDGLQSSLSDGIKNLQVHLMKDALNKDMPTALLRELDEINQRLDRVSRQGQTNSLGEKKSYRYFKDRMNVESLQGIAINKGEYIISDPTMETAYENMKNKSSQKVLRKGVLKNNKQKNKKSKKGEHQKKLKKTLMKKWKTPTSSNVKNVSSTEKVAEPLNQRTQNCRLVDPGSVGTASTKTDPSIDLQDHAVPHEKLMHTQQKVTNTNYELQQWDRISQLDGRVISPRPLTVSAPPGTPTSVITEASEKVNPEASFEAFKVALKETKLGSSHSDFDFALEDFKAALKDLKMREMRKEQKHPSRSSDSSSMSSSKNTATKKISRLFSINKSFCKSSKKVPVMSVPELYSNIPGGASSDALLSQTPPPNPTSWGPVLETWPQQGSKVDGYIIDQENTSLPINNVPIHTVKNISKPHNQSAFLMEDSAKEHNEASMNELEISNKMHSITDALTFFCALGGMATNNVASIDQHLKAEKYLGIITEEPEISQKLVQGKESIPWSWTFD